jgi:hypothetical protein
MKDRFLFLVALLAALAGFAPIDAFAQDPLADLIISINGDFDFESDNQFRYFNRNDCGLDDAGGTGGAGGVGGSGGVGGASGAGGAGGAGGTAGAGGAGGAGGISAAVQKRDPATTTFQIRLQETGSLQEVYLWVGGQNAGCERRENRNETMGTCGEVTGNPQSVGTNQTISELTLQDLLDARSGDTQIVTCESGLRGTPYEIYAFRNQAPGSDDVAPSDYGIAEFTVDVQPPNQPVVDTTPQRQSNFNITWNNPDPADDIQLWSFWFSDTNDAATAQPILTTGGTRLTAPLSELSQTISATTLGLGSGETGYVFVNAFDQAFVSDPFLANEGELSEGVMVTNVAVSGFCDVSGQCEGCSVSHRSFADLGGPGSSVWLLGLIFVLAALWRRRR